MQYSLQEDFELHKWTPPPFMLRASPQQSEAAKREEGEAAKGEEGKGAKGERGETAKGETRTEAKGKKVGGKRPKEN